MAGGIGERFKPLSTPEFPKQFHDLLGAGKSLLELTYNRFAQFIPTENIFIATNSRYKSIIQSQLKSFPSNQLLLETAKRNTAPCILYSALKISQKDPDGILIIAPTDHKIDNNAEFIDNLKTAAGFCENNEALVTLGITPDRPRTEYGYINYKMSDNLFKNVLKFTEKPNIIKATEFLKSGNYLWNAGIFICSVQSILNAFKEYQPTMFKLFNTGINFWDANEEFNFQKNIYPKSENISIDFGIMEHANNIYVHPTNFGWSDLGSWKSLYDILPKNKNNVAKVEGFEIKIDIDQKLNIYSNEKIVLQLD